MNAPPIYENLWATTPSERKTCRECENERAFGESFSSAEVYGDYNAVMSEQHRRA
jgi:hypothetical protein